MSLRIVAFLALCAFFNTSCTDSTVAHVTSDAGSTDYGCGYSHSALNSDPSVNLTSTVAWTCTDTTRTVTGNGVPDHAVGVFPNPDCPNTIGATSVSATMPLAPLNTGTATSPAPGGIGYAWNGVKFDPGTAGTCAVSNSVATCSLIGNVGSWHIEALGQSSFNFGVDSNNAHVQPTGAYHYHGMPEAVVAMWGDGTARLTLVGYALDGFPVYARYGHAVASDITSAAVVMHGSYQLKASPSAGRPSTATYPMGAFTEDYDYVEGSGDLDECNGRSGVTAEYPNGTYHYYITDTYPFIQRCLKGSYTDTGVMMTDGGVTGTTCATSANCSTNEVCCPAGQPCAGQCIPDCRIGGTCPNTLTCDTSTGACTL